MKKLPAKVSKIVPPDPIKIRLGRALESSGVTQSSLAKHFEITPQAVSEWFNPKKPGKCEPDKYVDLADLLGVNIRWLLSGKGPREDLPMTDETLDLLQRYKLLTSEQREAVSSVIDSFLAKRADPSRFKIG
jgi:transcriptional regulator with XRE-family HTH domain